MDPESGAAHRHNHYKEYLRWFHSIARVSVNPPRSNEPIEDRGDTDDDNDIVDEYDNITREGVQPERGPLQNYMVNHTHCHLTKNINLCKFAILCALTISF